MKSYLKIPTIVILALLFIGLAPQRALAKKTFVSKEGKFSVIFPKKPKFWQASESSPVGSIGQNIFQSKGRKGTFTVEYSMLPDIAVFFGGRKTIYKKAKKSFLEKTGSSELKHSKIKVAGLDALQLDFTNAKGQMGRAQFILVGRKLFVVVAESPRGEKPIEKFLGSFKLLP